jgi:hypothetical protein
MSVLPPSRFHWSMWWASVQDGGLGHPSIAQPPQIRASASFCRRVKSLCSRPKLSGYPFSSMTTEPVAPPQVRRSRSVIARGAGCPSRRTSPSPASTDLAVLVIFMIGAPDPRRMFGSASAPSLSNCSNASEASRCREHFAQSHGAHFALFSRGLTLDLGHADSSTLLGK